MFAAMRRASSHVRSLAAEHRPGYIRERLPALRLHDETGAVILDGPRRREAAAFEHSLPRYRAREFFPRLP
jgi:hypothetical protein